MSRVASCTVKCQRPRPQSQYIIDMAHVLSSKVANTGCEQLV